MERRSFSHHATLRAAWRALCAPVDADQRRTVAEAWERLAPENRVPHQTIGRQEEGCGGTIGAMPRCDFGCTGCYLGAEANRTPALPLDEVKAQFHVLRERLGRWGNLQLTDGEVLLRPEEEVIELLRYAREEAELIPMLMTHGDHFRRRPGLLERLMVEGGLVELSIHVDVTQRGRWGDAYRDARTEAELMPLRAEFAEIIRRARRATRRPLRVATTATVTDENFDEIPDLVRWCVDNADAFRILSLQPAAQVGRTRADVGGRIRYEDLWARIAEGLELDAERVAGNQWWFGHPECSRLVTGVVATQPDHPEHYEMIGMGSHPRDRAFLDGFITHFGGISFRNDQATVLVARLLGIVIRRPRIAFWTCGRFVASLVRRLDGRHPWRFATRLLRGRARIHPFTIGSHHFMSADELDTPEGEERLVQCIFTTPIDGELVSMCEVNARGVRDRLYEGIRLTVGAS